ncbi:MAG TPA: hypothetical protein VHK06_05650 [Candidatus Limnocylindria bacterium]|nr:hypothetical protein [Candidatus Limnocylindria bacterium]
MIVHTLPNRRRFTIPVLAPADRLASGLAHGLDDRFHYLRGVAAGGEPIDAVVVGPGGTWSISLTDVRGRFRRRSGHWYRWLASTESWVPWDAQPLIDARLAARRLGLVLERAGLPSIVAAGLLAWRGAGFDWGEEGRPGVVIQPEPERLAARIARDDVLGVAQVRRIVAFLDPRQPVGPLVQATPRD